MIRHSRPLVGTSELRNVSRLLASGNHATKEVVERFERRLSAFIGTAGAVATNSGTSALHIALLSLGIKGGDEVIIPSYVCTAVLNAVNYVDARPVLVDIDEDTFNVDYKCVLRKISKRTKAIVIPHMFGLPVDVKPFLDIGPFIIEDCAQVLGAGKDDKRVGSHGHISIFSFYATKLISTGHGGMLTAGSKTLLRKAKDLLDFDNRKDYRPRFNYNMTDFQAALGISQLARLGEFIKKRIRIASYYNKRFNKLPVRLPIAKENIYYRYVVRADKDASSLISDFRKKGIEAKRPVFKPLHRYLGLDNRNFPVTEKVFKEAVSIPLYPDLKDTMKKKIADTLSRAIEGIRC